MSDTFTLNIIFSGLIAFVPNSSPNPTAMAALLVNARGPSYSSDGCPLPRHYPALAIRAGKCSGECGWFEKALPRLVVADDVRWSVSINDEVLSIEADDSDNSDLNQLNAKLSAPPESVSGGNRNAPSDGFEASEFSWVAQPFLGQKVDEDCLRNPPRYCPIAGRVNIKRGKVTTCDFVGQKLYEGQATKLCDGSVPCITAHRFAMRPLAGAQAPWDPSQFLTDSVQVTMEEIPDTHPVLLHLKGFDGKERLISLTPDASKRIDVWVLNQPTIGATHAIPSFSSCHDDEYLDKHFEQYYNLAAPLPSGSPLPFLYRPIPSKVEAEQGPFPSFTAKGECRLPRKPINSGTGGIPGDKAACGNYGFGPSPSAGSN